MTKQIITDSDGPTSDDIDVLRVVLRSVQGSSPISSIPYSDLSQEE